MPITLLLYILYSILFYSISYILLFFILLFYAPTTPRQFPVCANIPGKKKNSDSDSDSELVLIEEFKNSLPDRIVTYLNEQKVGTLAQAAVLADEFVLSHKQTFGIPRYESRSFTPSASARMPSSPPRPLPFRSNEERECYYCHQTGHIKANDQKRLV